MAQESASKERFIQVGTFALRSPNGEFLPSVPLFIKEADAGGKSERTGLTVAEEIALIDVGKVFADKFKQYADGNKSKKQKGRGVKTNG